MAKYRPIREGDSLPENKLGVFGTHYPPFKKFKDFIEETERAFGKNDIYLRQPYHVNRRHQTSVENLYQRLKERYAGKDGLSGRKTYEDLLLGDCAFFSTVPTCLGLMSNNGLIPILINGAALYILEYARGCETVYLEMKTLLEEEIRYFAAHKEKYTAPEDYVIRYENKADEEYLHSLVRILFNRNADALRKNKEERNLQNREILNTVIALGKQNEEWSSYRNFFNRLMDMLKKEDIEKQLSNLQELEDEICDFLIKPQAEINKTIADLIDESNELSEKCRVRKKEVLSGGNITNDVLQNWENNFHRKPFLEAPYDKHGISKEISELEKLTNQALTQMDRLKEVTMKRISHLQGLSFMPSIPNYPDKMKSYLTENEFDEEEADKIIENLPMSSIRDPYGMCFAIIYAAEQNLDIVWNGGITDKALWMIATKLPIYNRLSPMCEKNYAGEKLNAPKGENIPEIRDEDVYGFNYTRKEKDRTRSMSLAQIIYEDTSHILPRDIEQANCFYQKYRWMDISEREALLMAYIVKIYRDMDQAIENIDPAAEEEKNDDQEESVEILKERIRELRSKCKNQEKQLYEADRTNREYQKTLESVRQEAEEDRSELADLREMIFNQQTAEEDQDTNEENRFMFPYTVKKDTVIFGGHRTWSKAIKPMLEGNVRFIDERTVYSFDQAIIANSEVIWIQVNAISHPAYYRIVEKARALHKKVRYFTKASAMAGAIQVAEEDIA